MKAIAEYFRDLAAEDRYFGAEPPTPDAAMLHKIAEREIQRRVEAKIQDNGVILRAGDADQAAPMLPHATRAELAGSTAPAPTPVVAAAVTPAAAPAAPATSPAVSESVAAKLMRIRSAVAQSQAAAAAPPIEADYSEDQHAGAAAEAYDEALLDESAFDGAFGDGVEAPAAAFDTAPENLADTAPLPEDDSLGLADPARAEDALPEDAPEPAPEAALPLVAEASDWSTEPEAEASLPDSTTTDAEMLANLADLTTAPPAEAVAEPPTEALTDLTDDFAEDLDEAPVTAAAPVFEDDLDTAEDEPATFTDDPEAFDIDADDLAELAALDAAPASDDSAPEADDVDADLAGLLASLQGHDQTAADPAPQPATEAATGFYGDIESDFVSGFTDDFTNHLPTPPTAPAIDAASEDRYAPQDEAEDEAEWDEAEQDEAEQVEAEQDEAEQDQAGQDEAEDEAEIAAELLADFDLPDDKPPVSEKAVRARARVIKIRRHHAISQPAAPAADAAALSPEAEADLLRELAGLEIETPPATPTAAAPTVIPRPVRPVRPISLNREAAPTTESRRKLDDNTEEDAVNRLIAQTNTEMEGPENRRRLSAIAHLKAAVVATVAERRSGGAPAPSEEDRIDPYRHDLSRMVRPNAGSDRPSPLVLISEQRIDRPADVSRQPVRPRRIAASSNLAVQGDHIDDEDDEDLDDADNIFSDTKGFVEFADRLGAQGLPALLEAAAAYTACIEGRDSFTRPQLFRQVSAASPEADFGREDTLRGFGTLLRNGKIVKVKRGLYALTDASHYLSEARKLAAN